MSLVALLGMERFTRRQIIATICAAVSIYQMSRRS